MALIECAGVWKTFHKHGGSKLLRSRLVEAFRPSAGAAFHALRGVSFTVGEGESLCIIGSNGAGKSTLLSLVCGLAVPDRGAIRVNGRVAPLLELGAGFHPDLSGRENLYLNASMMGFTEAQIRACFDRIVDFSGLSEFIDEPLRTYSTGMSMRLAFSIAVNVEPEILVVDEVLAVGDQAFTRKCLQRITELRRAGKTFLCVSHNTEIVRTLCDRALWLDAGQAVMTGAVEEVLAAYQGRKLAAAPDAKR